MKYERYSRRHEAWDYSEVEILLHVEKLYLFKAFSQIASMTEELSFVL
jgi:hypothetical protein